MTIQISVVIPTYNSSGTIRATLNSVMNQTVRPDEILVLDDGSTDDTVSILNCYGQSVQLFQQKNQGVASARNALCALAQGDLIAFLDHDDIWHPRYLEAQRAVFAAHPNAVALFTGHLNFYGHADHEWDDPHKSRLAPYVAPKVLSPINFMRAYTYQTGLFASMSFCCMPKIVLTSIGSEPFCTEVSGADDLCLFNRLPLVGTVVYTPAPLVAYRITETAQSHNRLKSVDLAVRAFEHLSEDYRHQAGSELSRLFGQAFATKRRHYAKLLMGASYKREAQRQLLHSLRACRCPLSVLKSLALLLLTCAPRPIQPDWIPANRPAIFSAQAKGRTTQKGANYSTTLKNRT